MTEALSPLQPTSLADPWAPPEGRHPALTYLNALAPSGRRSQRVGLERIARRFSGDLLSWDQFPWHLVRYEHASTILAWLKEAFPSPATANNYRAALRGVLRQCWLLRYLDGDEWTRIQTIKPVRGSRLPRGRNIDDSEMASLFRLLASEGTVVAARDAAWLAVAYSSGGVRLDETLTMTLAQFAAADRSFRVIGKGNKERKVSLAHEADEALRAWLRLRGDEPGCVFLAVARDRTTVLHGKGLAASTIREMCRRRARQAGIAPFSPHDLRRSSISAILEQTGDLSTAKRLAGHATVATTERYDLREDKKAEAVARRLHVPYVAPGGAA